MIRSSLGSLVKFKSFVCLNSRIAKLQRCYFSQELEEKYSQPQKEKILRIINESDSDMLTGYEVTKGRLKKFSQWKKNNGAVKNISDIELIEGFCHKTAAKLCDSILEGPKKEQTLTNKIKGQFLHPNLSESVRKSCETVLSLFIAVNSVSWTLIEKTKYEVVKWQYHGIDYPDGKRFQITDILDIAWTVTQSLPLADIYVMKAEVTTLRAAGSDPNNPKVIAVNLQKAQMTAMIVALINARSYNLRIVEETSDSEDGFKQCVYFLRPTLPFRLYGTLVGNEEVTTDQTIEMLLQNATEISNNHSHVYIPGGLQKMFRNQKDLQKDMMGHSLLLALTFMDLCIYRNQDRINKLIRKRQH